MTIQVSDDERKQQSPAAEDAILAVKSSESSAGRAYFDASSNEAMASAERGGLNNNAERISPSTTTEDETTERAAIDHQRQHHRALTDYSQGGSVNTNRGVVLTALTRGLPQNDSGESTMTLHPEELNELLDLLPTIRSWQTAQTHSSAAVCGPPPPQQPHSSPTGVSPRTRASTAGFSIAALDDDDISDCSSEDNAGVDDYVRLSRDIYSILFVTNPKKHGFLFAILVFVFQIFVLALVCVDVIDLQSQNPLDIPAGVSTAVRAAQFIAILVSVATQDDLITSVSECMSCTFCLCVFSSRISYLTYFDTNGDCTSPSSFLQTGCIMDIPRMQFISIMAENSGNGHWPSPSASSRAVYVWP